MAAETARPNAVAFAEDGYVLKKGFLSAEEAAGLREHMDGFIADKLASLPSEHVFIEDKGDVSTLKQIQQLHVHDARIAKLGEGRCRALAEGIFGPCTLKNVQYFNKPPGKSKATPCHQDGFYFMIAPQRAITMWMALDHAEPDNGCLWYVRDSHRKGMRAHQVSGVLGFSQKCTDYGTAEDLENEMAMVAEPGDLIGHHSLMLHRAGPNTTKAAPRRALGFIFYADDVEEDTAAHERYQASLKAELARAGRI